MRPDDILLASYPGSGNTWLQFLLANLIHPDREVNLGNLHRLIVDPDITVKREIDRIRAPRIVKTHGSFDPRYRRVIYEVRDPRDVVLAGYNDLRHNDLRHSRKSGEEMPLEAFIGRFLAGELNRDLGSWGENAGSWLAARCGDPGFLLVRYEDLVAGTARELTRTADFAGLPSAPERIARAVERGSALPSVKSSWRHDLPAPQVARIEAAWGDVMACLGYELVTRDHGSALESSLLAVLTAHSDDRRGAI